MELQKIKDIVINSAPVLASVITDINPMAGMVVKLIANVFDADSNNSNDIISKITQDPDSSVKLKQIELDHQSALFETQENSFKASLIDRQDARRREENITKITNHEDWIMDGIAVIVIVGFFSMCIAVCFYKVDASAHDILYMLIGQLIAGFIMVLSYYFGSSNK